MSDIAQTPCNGSIDLLAWGDHHAKPAAMARSGGEATGQGTRLPPGHRRSRARWGIAPSSCASLAVGVMSLGVLSSNL